jgi:hypothetical protein
MMTRRNEDDRHDGRGSQREESGMIVMVLRDGDEKKRG